MNTRSLARALFYRLTVFYVLLFGLTSIAFYIEPDIGSHLPIGDIERHLNTDTQGTFDGIEIQASQVVTEFDSMVWLVTAILGSVILMIPVAWTYLSIRRLHQMACRK